MVDTPARHNIVKIRDSKFSIYYKNLILLKKYLSIYLYLCHDIDHSNFDIVPSGGLRALLL